MTMLETTLEGSAKRAISAFEPRYRADFMTMSKQQSTGFDPGARRFAPAGTQNRQDMTAEPQNKPFSAPKPQLSMSVSDLRKDPELWRSRAWYYQGHKVTGLGEDGIQYKLGVGRVIKKYYQRYLVDPRAIISTKV